MYTNLFIQNGSWLDDCYQVFCSLSHVLSAPLVPGSLLGTPEDLNVQEGQITPLPHAPCYTGQNTVATGEVTTSLWDWRKASISGSKDLTLNNYLPALGGNQREVQFNSGWTFPSYGSQSWIRGEIWASGEQRNQKVLYTGSSCYVS